MWVGSRTDPEAAKMAARQLEEAARVDGHDGLVFRTDAASLGMRSPKGLCRTAGGTSSVTDCLGTWVLTMITKGTVN